MVLNHIVHPRGPVLAPKLGAARTIGCKLGAAGWAFFASGRISTSQSDCNEVAQAPYSVGYLTYIVIAHYTL